MHNVVSASPYHSREGHGVVSISQMRKLRQTCDDALKGTKLTGAGAQSLSSFMDALLKERERVPVLLSALSLNLRVYSEESEHTVEWIMGSIQASIAGPCKKMLLKLFT